jgi:hypothetical protein
MAVVPQKARKLLSRFDARSLHHEVKAEMQKRLYSSPGRDTSQYGKPPLRLSTARRSLTRGTFQKAWRNYPRGLLRLRGQELS